MAEELFSSLVDMQIKACATHASNKLFGTKVNGTYVWMTYREFAEQVDRARAAFATLGVKRGDKVAVIANNRVEWAVGAYATYSLGAHYVPMYEAQLEKDWRYILEDSGSVLLLVANQAIYSRVAGWVGEVGNLQHVLAFDTDSGAAHGLATVLAAADPGAVPPVMPEAEEVAGLIYTSGTTGKPKGVVLTHGNFISNVNAVHAIFPLSSEDTSCSFLPWAHSFGQTVELHVLLSMGSAIGIAESVQTLLDDFLLVKPTVLFAVPRIFNRIYDGLQKRMANEKPVKRMMFNKGLAVAQRRRELAAQGKQSALVEWQYGLFDKLVFSKVKARFGGRLKYAFSGGAALSKEVGTFIDDIGILVFEGYGLTETSPIATANTPDHRQLGTIGKAVPGVRIIILDESQNPVADGVDGEICVIGPNVMREYHNHPESTAEVVFERDGDRIFRTGDMGRIQLDGFIKITGRFKEQYKLENGKYVVPSPLEEHLKLSGFVSQAFIFGDNKLYNVCLVVPDFDALAGWARENGVADTSPAALCRDPKCHAKIGEELARFSGEFKGYEKARKWALLEEEFTTENDLLTPKMSVKRRNVIARYQAELDALYAD